MQMAKTSRSLERHYCIPHSFCAWGSLGIATYLVHAHYRTATCQGLVFPLFDPQKLGRVRLKFPWLSDDYESDWARMLQAGAGPDSGACFLPEVNDEVLTAFEFGDVRRPVVIGGLHNGRDKPRLGDGLVDNGRVRRRGFVSRRGQIGRAHV